MPRECHGLSIRRSNSGAKKAAIREVSEETVPMNSIQSLSLSARLLAFSLVISLAIGTLTAAATVL